MQCSLHNEGTQDQDMPGIILSDCSVEVLYVCPSNFTSEVKTTCPKLMEDHLNENHFLL